MRPPAGYRPPGVALLWAYQGARWEARALWAFLATRADADGVCDGVTWADMAAVFDGASRRFVGYLLDALEAAQMLERYGGHGVGVYRLRAPGRWAVRPELIRAKVLRRPPDTDASGGQERAAMLAEDVRIERVRQWARAQP